MRGKRFFGEAVLHIPLIIFSITIILPLIVMITTSFAGTTSGVFTLFPKKIDLTGYQLIFSNPSTILNGYLTSIIVTVVGTLLSMVATTGVAYALSRYDFRYRNAISFYVYFTMLFSGGLVPTYILMTQYLHLTDSIWALILPYLVNAFYVLILRTFMQKIPMELIESCYIEGAGEYRIFVQFILPLSKPGLATVGLLTVFVYWNDWWLSMLYIEMSRWMPLQGVLTRIMNNFTFVTGSLTTLPMGVTLQNLPSESMRMGMALLAAGPILIVFLFFQKFFIKGITVGALKG